MAVANGLCYTYNIWYNITEIAKRIRCGKSGKVKGRKWTN